MPRAKKSNRVTSTGHPLTIREDAFIDEYIKTGNGAQSVINAGYKVKNPYTYAQDLKEKPYITDEIAYRTEKLHSERIADATEIMEYFSKVMRGEITDQFGLEASLSERTKAAQELAKRQIDMVNKAQMNSTPELKISLNFSDDRNATNTPALPTVRDVIGDTNIEEMVNNLLKEDSEAVVNIEETDQE